MARSGGGSAAERRRGGLRGVVVGSARLGWRGRKDILSGRIDSERRENTVVANVCNFAQGHVHLTKRFAGRTEKLGKRSTI